MTKKRKNAKDTRSLCEKIYELDGGFTKKVKKQKVDLIPLLELGITGIDTVLTCQKCGSHKIKNQSVQTRRADEGATLFCFCLDCENQWKEQQ